MSGRRNKTADQSESFPFIIPPLRAYQPRLVSPCPLVPSLLPQTRFLWVENFSGVLWAPRRPDPRSGLVFFSLLWLPFLLFLSHGPRGAQSDSSACPPANFPSSQSRGRQMQGFWCEKPNATKEKKNKNKNTPSGWDEEGRLSSVPRNGVCFKNARISRRSWKATRAAFNFAFLFTFPVRSVW